MVAYTSRAWLSSRVVYKHKLFASNPGFEADAFRCLQLAQIQNFQLCSKEFHYLSALEISQ